MRTKNMTNVVQQYW